MGEFVCTASHCKTIQTSSAIHSLLVHVEFPVIPVGSFLLNLLTRDTETCISCVIYSWDKIELWLSRKWFLNIIINSPGCWTFVCVLPARTSGVNRGNSPPSQSRMDELTTGVYFYASKRQFVSEKTFFFLIWGGGREYFPVSFYRFVSLRLNFSLIVVIWVVVVCNTKWLTF